MASSDYTSDIPLKQCTTCKEWKPLEDFHRDKSSRDGRKWACKACSCARRREEHRANAEKENARNRELHNPEQRRAYRRQNADKIRERKRKYNQKNADRISEQRKEYRKRNEDKFREYSKRYYAEHKDYYAERARVAYERDPERYRSYSRRYYSEHKEQYAKKRKEWLKDNIEYTKAYSIEYRKRHPERRRIHDQQRRARKAGLADNFTASEWFAALDYWGHCCAYCGSQQGFWNPITADHFIPLVSSECSGTIANNIVPACKSCNSSKNDSEPNQWLERKFGKRRAREILKRIQAYFDSLD